MDERQEKSTRRGSWRIGIAVLAGAVAFSLMLGSVDFFFDLVGPLLFTGYFLVWLAIEIVKDVRRSDERHGHGAGIGRTRKGSKRVAGG